MAVDAKSRLELVIWCGKFITQLSFFHYVRVKRHLMNPIALHPALSKIHLCSLLLSKDNSFESTVESRFSFFHTMQISKKITQKVQQKVSKITGTAHIRRNEREGVPSQVLLLTDRRILFPLLLWIGEVLEQTQDTLCRRMRHEHIATWMFPRNPIARLINHYRCKLAVIPFWLEIQTAHSSQKSFKNR